MTEPSSPPTSQLRLTGVLTRWAPALVLGLGVLITLARFDVPVSASVRYFLYLFLVVLLPGRLVWKAVMGRHEAANLGLPHLHTRLEDWVCGAAVGYGIELLCYVPARAMGHPRLYLLGPVAILLVGGISSWVRSRSDRTVIAEPREPLPARVTWLLAGVVAYLAAWIAVRLFTSHPLRSTALVDPDEMFQLALVGELRHHFPAQYPYMEYPGGLTYQWFVHAHLAASTWATGLPGETLYRRFDPLVLGTLAVLGVGVIAARLTRSVWALPLASACLVLVGSFDVTGATLGEATPEERFLQGMILMHSPTQTFAYVLAVPIVILCLESVRVGSVFRPSTWVFVAAAMAIVSGAKVTFLPLFICGFAAGLGASLLRRKRPDKNALIGLVLTVLVIAVSSRVLYAGDTQSLGLAPLQSTRFFMKALGVLGGGIPGELMVTGSLLAMWLLPGVGAVAVARNRATRWDPRFWWLLGAIASGYGATFLLGHVGNSQVYFGRAASLLVAVLAAWGLVLLYERAGRREVASGLVLAAVAGSVLFGLRLVTEQWREPAPVKGEMVESPVLRVWVNLPVLIVLLLVVVITGIALRDLTNGRRRVTLRATVVLLTGLGLARSLAFVTGHIPAEAEESSRMVFGADGRRAAEWLRLHSDESDVVMTNVHCGPARPVSGQCDARHFWMSAIAERRFVLEGWAYTARSGTWIGDFWGDPALLEENDRVFTRPTAERLEAFQSAHPVSWMFVDSRGPVDEPALRNLSAVSFAFGAGPYSVYRVR